jgi:hypothetical protein
LLRVLGGVYLGGVLCRGVAFGREEGYGEDGFPSGLLLSASDSRCGCLHACRRPGWPCTE